MSSSEYLHKNRQIIQRACSLIVDYKPKWVLTVSSGATQNSDESNYYGQLKLEEENALSNACKLSGSTLVIGRLWGATGFSMPINRNYAISDFICQVLETGTIKVNSSFEVWRRYVDADQFMHLLYTRAMDGDSVIINSGGPKIEIGELANRIAFNLGIKDQVVRNIESDSQLIDNYFFSGNEYELALNKSGIIAKGIDEQVSDTILGHKLQLQTKKD
jgi:nucleoside-diphosphate-sugar epimerase